MEKDWKVTPPQDFIDDLAEQVINSDKFAEGVNEVIDVDSIDISDLTNRVERQIDLGYLASELDYSDIADRVIENIDYDEIKANISIDDDVEKVVESLLLAYDPDRPCDVGSAFTYAVSMALEFLRKSGAMNSGSADPDFIAVSKFVQKILIEIDHPDKNNIQFVLDITNKVK